MTPKEKAIELCQSFGYIAIKWEQTDYTTLSLENAKECAIISVDEIIKAKPTAEYGDPFIGNHSYDNVSYWQDVKKEIEKL